MPDTAEYLARIQSFASDKDVLELQSETPKTLAGLIEGVNEEKLRARPLPGKWSVSEILAHLAEDEIVTAWRYRQMVEAPGCQLAGFDQDLWARLGDYGKRKPQESLQMFTLLRESNVMMLRKLTSEEWQRYGIHAERGKITVQDLARHMAGHDANHVQQIRTILDK